MAYNRFKASSNEARRRLPPPRRHASVPPAFGAPLPQPPSMTVSSLTTEDLRRILFSILFDTLTDGSHSSNGKDEQPYSHTSQLIPKKKRHRGVKIHKKRRQSFAADPEPDETSSGCVLAASSGVPTYTT